MTTKMLTLIFCYILFHLWNLTTVMCGDYCYMKDNNSYTNFGSKTAYENVHGDDVYIIPGCKVIYIWTLMRHGTRYGAPENHRVAKNMSVVRDQIIENHEVYKRGKLCDDDLKNLKNWTDQWSDKIYYDLAPQGEKDLKGLANRLKAKLGYHLAFYKEKFEIQTSSRRWCQQSSVVFTNELFGTSYADLVGNNISANDQLLLIIWNRPPVQEELKKFITSKYMEKVINEVTNRLGYDSRLSYESIVNLYAYCSYENAWFVHSKPAFCASFEEEHLKILEYRDDLYYYGFSYKNQTARRMACPIVQDLLTKLTSAGNSSEDNLLKRGTIYVAHGETLLPTFAQLGLFEVEKPFSHNYEFQSERSWRSSLINPFLTNLIAILYKCTDGFKIVFYHNEKIIKFPGCQENVCSLEKFQEYLSQKISKDCSQNCSSRQIRSGLLFVVIICIIILSMRFFIE